MSRSGRVAGRAKASDPAAASRKIDEKIAELGDWRGERLAEIRRLIHEVDPEVVEDWKWMGTPVWSHDGMYALANAHKDKVKITFFHGARLSDPRKLFNAGLTGGTWRAIDLREGDKIDRPALKALLREAVAYNTTHAVPKSKGSRERLLGAAGSGAGGRAKGKPAAAGPARATGKASRSTATRSKTSRSTATRSKTPRSTATRSKTSRSTATRSKASRTGAKPALLAGGNPQIAKATGDAPVQAYIAAMPGWKRDVGRWLDALITRTVPGVLKAVKWNSPFYGVDGQGWFLSLHCYTRYVKVAFFRGTSLRPLPPGESKHDEVRYLDIHEDDTLDAKLLTRWLRQAAKLPGWTP